MPKTPKYKKYCDEMMYFNERLCFLVIFLKQPRYIFERFDRSYRSGVNKYTQLYQKEKEQY